LLTYSKRITSEPADSPLEDASEICFTPPHDLEVKSTLQEMVGEPINSTFKSRSLILYEDHVSSKANYPSSSLGRIGNGLIPWKRVEVTANFTKLVR
jgi:hypothetical protein